MIAAPLALIYIFFATLIGAGLYDIKTYTIPNIIPIVVMALFILAGLVVPLSLTEWGWQILAGTFAFSLGFGLFVLGLMGGGDVKLYGAIGLWVLPSKILMLTAFITVTGALLALTVLGFKIIKVRRGGNSVKNWKQAYFASRRTRIPYGPAITIGTILFWISTAV